MLLPILATMALALPDRLLADFDGADYGDWTKSGVAFGEGPARGTLPNQMPVSGYLGKGLVTTYFGGDDSTGTLLSPLFTIDRRYLSFRIGGGYDPLRLALQLIVDGTVVRSATGPNRAPGGSEALSPDAWDVASLKGKTAALRIIDEATGGWGHINVDHIVLTDTKPPMTLENASRTLDLTRRFLIVPIKNGAPARKVTFQVEGEPAVTNDVELADGKPDWHAAIDVAIWKGRKATIVVDRLSDESLGLKGISVTAEIPDKPAPYREEQRGQIHFSPRRGWLNDPNGLVFYQGEFHLFFQHNPYGWGWGNMHWGHAVSRDLVHWTELPIALYPDRMGTMFSGSAVVDHANTSGFGSANQPPMVLAYTAAGTPFVQGIAWTTDGRTFTKWEGNPIVGSLATGDRDPKVVWHEPTKRWVMVLYLEIPNRPTVQFLSSPDLKAWTPHSRIEGFHECPDLFELPISGRPGESKWVLTGANSDYQVGDFDGKEFKPESPILKGQQGRGFYAAQTFDNTPGRRIQIGWFQTETHDMPFNQSMSIPMDLSLVPTDEGPRLAWNPVPELRSLRLSSRALGPIALQPEGKDPLEGVSGEIVEIELEIEPSGSSKTILNVRGIEIAYDATSQEIEVAGHRAPAQLENGRQRLQVFCDRTGLEVFASGGRTFVPMPLAPDRQNRSPGIRVSGGAVKIPRLEVHELRSIWHP